MRKKVALLCIAASSPGVGLVVGAGCNHDSAQLSPDGGDGAVTLEAGATEGGETGDAAAGGLQQTDADAGPVGCHAGSVSGFQPTAPFGVRTSASACNGFGGDGGLVQSYGVACIGHSSTYDTCAAFMVPDAGHASECYDCLVTPVTLDGSALGVVAVFPVPLVNYAGCMKLFDPDAGESCARDLTAAAECSHYACTSTCPPVTDQVSFNAFMACWNETTSGACGGYWLAVNGCTTQEQANDASAVASICFGGITGEDHYLAMARAMCGAN